jgi:hypothetical protein
MSPVIKPKPLRRNSARLTRHAKRAEDDAEQALKEIAAAHAKLTDRSHDNTMVSREKKMKGRP